MTHKHDIEETLQREKEALLAQGSSAKRVTKSLRVLSDKRARLSKEYDRKLVKEIAEHIMDMSDEYDLRVVIGQLRGIRGKARKGNYRGRKFRGMIHRWAFARFREYLQHELETLGFDAKRFFVVNESWTSIKCHKCGNKGYRPKQNLFVCGTCGYRANADLNGAINIGRRVIKLIPSLRDEKTGLGVWLLPHEKSIPKASRSKRSKRKSSLPQRKPALLGESVAECYEQTTLSGSTKDLVMVSTVKTPSASGESGDPGGMQRTEAGSQWRDHISMKRGKAHVTRSDSGHLEVGDNSREKGGTQKFLAVHSTRKEQVF